MAMVILMITCRCRLYGTIISIGLYYRDRIDDIDGDGLVCAIRMVRIRPIANVLQRSIPSENCVKHSSPEVRPMPTTQCQTTDDWTLEMGMETGRDGHMVMGIGDGMEMEMEMM